MTPADWLRDRDPSTSPQSWKPCRDIGTRAWCRWSPSNTGRTGARRQPGPSAICTVSWMAWHLHPPRFNGTGYNKASWTPNPASRVRNPGPMKGRGAIAVPHSQPAIRAAVRVVSFLCLWCLLPALSASGAYKNLAVKVSPAEGYASRQSQGPVTIAADPYPSETRIRTAFDVKGLSKLGLVPINIIISNQGPDALSVNGATITLLDPEYGSLPAIPPIAVVKMVLNQARGRSEDSRPLSPASDPHSRKPSGETGFRDGDRLHSKIAQTPNPTPGHGLGLCLLPASRETIKPNRL